MSEKTYLVDDESRLLRELRRRGMKTGHAPGGHGEPTGYPRPPAAARDERERFPKRIGDAPTSSPFPAAISTNLPR